MKIPLFTLTKGEQRVVIIIMMALLAAAFARHYHEAKSHTYKPIPINTTAAPLPAEEENPPDGAKGE